MHLPPPDYYLHYRLFHYSTKSNNYMYKCSKNINPNCEHCGLSEDNLHLFIKCTRISKVWKHYQPLLTKLLRKSHTPLQYTLTISIISTHKHTIKLTLTIIQLILFEICQSRNNNKYDKILLSQHTIIHKINAQLQYIIQTQDNNFKNYSV